MYIKELFEMKAKIKSTGDLNWRSAPLLDQWRKVNNDIEEVVWIKKSKQSLYVMSDIRGAGKNLYLK
jgi:hypothetical protein